MNVFCHRVMVKRSRIVHFKATIWSTRCGRWLDSRTWGDPPEYDSPVTCKVCQRRGEA